MDIIDDDRSTHRLNQIQQFPQVKLSHDDIHSNCSICISNFTKDEIILILPCVHKFHRSCIQTWLAEHNTCPTCRETVMDSIHEISDGEWSDNHSDEDVEILEDSLDSLIAPSGIVFNLINSYFDSADESLSDMSLDRISVAVDVSSDDSLASEANTTLENSTVSGDISITVSEPSELSDESDNMIESLNSSSSEGSDSSNVMLPSSDDESENNWEMSADSSDEYSD